ncbi:hypothetical protein GCM10009416_41080 [Craurococcus roseus]|uniref:Type II toxin-antitoxin system PemK/MazF family toxin n=1 Tax=Craurococcus roseus TaxID=77585 RepID=A0ABN1FVH7_9PROT
MKRGEIWTAADRSSEYAGKPGPVLVLQDDAFAGTDSVVVVPFTSDPTVAPLLRLPVAPGAANNLSRPCSLMVEKVTAVRRTNIGRLVGRLDDRSMATVGTMAATLLGLARPALPPARRAASGAAAKTRMAPAKALAARKPPRAPR